MNQTTTQVLLWLPAVIIPIVAIAWLISFPKKQRKNHDAEAFGISMVGVAISLLAWSFWFLKDQLGSNEVKLKVADYVVWAAIIGTVATIFACAIFYLRGKLTGNQSGKKKKKNKK